MQRTARQQQTFDTDTINNSRVCQPARHQTFDTGTINDSPVRHHAKERSKPWVYVPLKTQTALLPGKSGRDGAKQSLQESETDIEAASAHPSDWILDLRPGRRETSLTICM